MILFRIIDYCVRWQAYKIQENIARFDHMQRMTRIDKEMLQGIMILSSSYIWNFYNIFHLSFAIFLFIIFTFCRDASGGRLNQVNENIRVDGLYGFHRVSDTKERTGFLINMHSVSIERRGKYMQNNYAALLFKLFHFCLL